MAAETRFLESDFFERADTLWEQLGRAVGAEGQDGAGPLNHVCSEGSYAFLMATADRIFSHDLTLAFLKRLREWGKEKLEARHVSTPQVHVYVKGCHRELAQDATPARWHYLYSLARSESPNIRLLWEGGLQKRRFQIGLGRVANVRLRFNQLLVHETRQAYGVDGPNRAANPLDGAILLHGYLW